MSTPQRHLYPVPPADEPPVTSTEEDTIIEAVIIDDPNTEDRLPVPSRRIIDAVGTVVGQRVEHVRQQHGSLALASLRVSGRGIGYGGLGVARTVASYYRWVTAAEHDAVLATQPQFVEQVRARRRKVSLWGLGTLAAGDGALVLFADWTWWTAPSLGLAAVATVGGVVEAVRRRLAVQNTQEGQEVRTLGTHPGSKAVRHAIANAGGLGKADEVRVLPPGVIRDDQSSVPAWTAIADLKPGIPAAKAVKRQQELASAFGVDMTQLDVDPVKGHNGRVKFWVADFDPLTGDTIVSPLKGRATPVDAWTEKASVGKDRRGRWVSFALPERSLLTGGEPGGGKSVSCNNVLCFAALDPFVDLRMVDGKGGADLIDYEPLSTQFLAEPDPLAMLDLCTQIQDEMSDRYRTLKSLGERKLTREIAVETGMRLTLLHIDEIQFFAAARGKTGVPGDDEGGKAKVGDLIVDALWDIVSRGRAAGFITSAATQRPAAEVVPSKLRDILSIRWALRCTTPQASDTILGQGWASQGFNAARIDVTQRGAGLLLAEGSVPTWLRSCFLSDNDIKAISRTAYRLREAAGTLPATETHPGRLLLEACLRVCGERDKIWTADLLAGLAGQAAWERPAAMFDEAADAARELARLLKPYGVAPRGQDIDGVNRNGYRRSDFEDALNRLMRR
ncbi:FtsK/SpoIIIE domain-containing protein [Nonomuraea sp. NPDC050310]|uniref:FtsK/SpoIIIE domain-containing protein n=1 Tax=Nonomuraea sp. NPDC050310 TaxID=3154935 RepID=UPI0033E3EE0E